MPVDCRKHFLLTDKTEQKHYLLHRGYKISSVMWMKGFISVSDKIRMCNVIDITSGQLNHMKVHKSKWWPYCVYMSAPMHVRRLFLWWQNTFRCKMLIKTKHTNYTLQFENIFAMNIKIMNGVSCFLKFG